MENIKPFCARHIIITEKTRTKTIAHWWRSVRDREWKRKKKEWERGRCKSTAVVYCGVKLSLEEGSGKKLGLGMADTGCECVHFIRSSHSSAAGKRRVGPVRLLQISFGKCHSGAIYVIMCTWPGAFDSGHLSVKITLDISHVTVSFSVYQSSQRSFFI